MSIKVETPPNLKGNEVEQLKQVYSYLFRLSENLNIALNNIDKDSFSEKAAAALTAETGSKDQQAPGGGIDLSNSYNELKALIQNTSSYVEKEMTLIRTELESQYTAISEDWGTYRENITNTIEATAEAIIQRYGYDAEIETLQEAAAGFSAYKIKTEGYIRQGFIDFDENNVPIIGIAIGQGLTSTSVTVGGEEYQQIDSSQSCAFYTADKVSFRINGQEVAYISNSKLYIRDAEITGTLSMGGEWLLSRTNGFGIKWIGGAV